MLAMCHASNKLLPEKLTLMVVSENWLGYCAAEESPSVGGRIVDFSIFACIALALE
jgi:hypothetical protein